MSAMARGRLLCCPACERMVTATGAGTYRAHRDGAGEPCPWGGLPVDPVGDTPAAVAEVPPVRASAVPVSSPAVMPRKATTPPDPEPQPTTPPRKGGRAARDVATVGTRGQFTIPPAIREQIGLQEGDVFQITVNDDGTLTLTPMRLQPLPAREG